MAISGGRLMYQFMVGVTTPGVTRMAMTSGTNKWASRVVVILQLAAWSAVGIVLLQKGVTSLQKKTLDNNNITQKTSSSENINQYSDLSVIPMINQNLRNRVDEIPLKTPPLDPEDEPRVLESVESPKSNESLKKIQKPTKIRPKWGDREENPLPISTSKYPFSFETERLTDKTEDVNITDRISQKPEDLESSSPLPTTKSGIWESRRRLRLSHLSGGGAAAAVAMVAVGAVMLVLGPAVIVLRALDERRQERRFLKLSGRNDLPPTYEQATLMDEAPRYSSLSLNTILGPPPPPSPTPARVHLV
ncbi:uncharacterized protein LOC135164132 [Diachasmimorpha longicaudata]|uniref:uncharacterized protein LOC135164132 n=1 Tax=Diachasmimorpha longicaudata TaxID=58733 RepID=UPI0030B8BB17